MRAHAPNGVKILVVLYICVVCTRYCTMSSYTNIILKRIFVLFFLYSVEPIHCVCVCVSVWDDLHNDFLILEIANCFVY